MQLYANHLLKLSSHIINYSLELEFSQYLLPLIPDCKFYLVLIQKSFASLSCYFAHVLLVYPRNMYNLLNIYLNCVFAFSKIK